jgi:hypothetical protein
MGTQVLGTSTFLVLGPLQVTVASLKPYFHLSIRDRAFPILNLQAPTCAESSASR